jgi:5-methylcytosine-specific restriction endonuclease McrA
MPTAYQVFKTEKNKEKEFLNYNINEGENIKSLIAKKCREEWSSLSEINKEKYEEKSKKINDVYNESLIKIISTEIYENQRWSGPFSRKWKEPKSVLFTDRMMWSSRDGIIGHPSLDSIPPGIGLEWKDGATWNIKGNGEGWEYAIDFKSNNWYSNNFALACVRRRLYIRDSVPETNEEDIIKLKTHKSKTRKKIPKAVRKAAWNKYIDNKKLYGLCYVGCGNEIQIDNFELGHVIAFSKGGEDILDNLRPICLLCNRSMGTQNLEEFRTLYGFDKSNISKLRDELLHKEIMEEIVNIDQGYEELNKNIGVEI